MYSLIIFILYYLCQLLIPTVTACVEPSLECPNINVTYWLYTKTNEKKPFQISVNDSNSIINAPWVIDAPIKILIHGYTGHKDFSPNTEIRPVYLKLYDYNVISVDYRPIARDPCYIQAAHNTELVGKCTAQLIDELVNNYGFPLELFHVIGFSLGGQVAGYTGHYTKSGKLNRISGLDPALPLFVSNDVNKKLDKDDALFVDVLHTNSLEKGKLEASGHVDFFANGGVKQPGCQNSVDTISGCSHGRAPMYYAESITSKTGFYGTKCQSWIIYLIGWCELYPPNDEALYGENMSRNIEGLYFFDTNDNAPYARGKENTSKNRIERSLSWNLPQIT